MDGIIEGLKDGLPVGCSEGNCEDRVVRDKVG